MNVAYNRKMPPAPVHKSALKCGKFYRAADDHRREPRILFATDEGQVVSLQRGIQYGANLHDLYVEVEVSITVGDDA